MGYDCPFNNGNHVMAYFPSCETGTYISTIIFIQLYICTDTCPYYILQGQTGQQRPGDSMTLLLIWLSDGVAAKTSASRSKNMVPHMANADESDDTPLRPFKFGCAIVFWINLASMDWSKGNISVSRRIYLQSILGQIHYNVYIV